MRASDIKVGDVIDGWTVIDVVILGRWMAPSFPRCPFVVLLKLEVRIHDAVVSTATTGSGGYITSGVPRVDWYRADDEVEVERADD